MPLVRAIIKFVKTLIPAILVILGYHFNEISLAVGFVIGWALFSANATYSYEKGLEELSKCLRIEYEGRTTDKEGEDRDK